MGAPLWESAGIHLAGQEVRDSRESLPWPPVRASLTTGRRRLCRGLGRDVNPEREDPDHAPGLALDCMVLQGVPLQP